MRLAASEVYWNTQRKAKNKFRHNIDSSLNEIVTVYIKYVCTYIYSKCVNFDATAVVKVT